MPNLYFPKLYHRSLLGSLVALSLVFIAVQAQARTAPDSFADLAERLLPSVVNISTTQVIKGRDLPEMPKLPPGSPFEDFFKEFFDHNQSQQRQRKVTSLGSGFIIDVNGGGEGYVVTNNHVIQDADEITVILHDNTRLEAKVVGRDLKTDLAVLKVKSKEPLTAVKFGNSDVTRVGDWVVAIGNPFGLGGTVTAGIVSARGRDINSGPYDDFIQTDASINRGNSGGPMFNLKGNVIGINTAIFSPSGGSVGIGFAIPSSTARPVIEQLIKNGKVSRGWLGVHIQGVTDEIAETLGLDKARGALVANVVKGGPAEKAKIKAGDVILSFNGKGVPEMRKLPRMVAEASVGKTVDVEIWRDSKKITLKVKVGKLKEEKPQAAANESEKSPTATAEVEIEGLGLSLAAVNADTKERFKLQGDVKGVVVTKVKDGGVAAEKGIRPGDVIVEVSQAEVSTPAQVAAKVAKAKDAGRKSVLMLIEGQGGLRFVAIRVDKG
ncbi:MAG TPA: DegQ family serine endoprotease [Alphaproteobacteria bacterium]|nr:DegQ family serine endoprotease [Alphaproteobacteria bacterium]